jgi:hypothetical protein
MLKNASWTIPTSNVKIIHNMPALITSRSQFVADTVKEIVFFGPLNIAGGLKTFCDALDLIASDLAASKIQVTILGSPSSINEMTSQEYVELRAQNWEKYDLTWSIRVAADIYSSVKYLGDKSTGKIVVMPGVSDLTGSLAQTLLKIGVPFLASESNGIKEFLSTEDQQKLLIESVGKSLAAKLKNVLANGSSKWN